MHTVSQDSPIFVVDEQALRNFDPQDPLDLHRLWSRFSKVSPDIDQGKRYENFSFRLLNREALRSSTRHSASATSHPSAGTVRTPEISQRPPLSRSPDSAASDDSAVSPTCADARSSPLHTYRSLQNSTPGEGAHPPLSRHTKPVDLAKMIHSIKEDHELKTIGSLQVPPNSAVPPTSTPTTPQHVPPPRLTPRCSNAESSTSTIPTSSSYDSHATAPTSFSSNDSSHSVVRGFQPGAPGMTSYKSNSQLAPSNPTPILKTPKEPVKVDSKKKRGFILGSGSSGEDESSLKSRMSPVFGHGSDGSQRGSGCKKQTSFKEEVTVVKEQVPEEHPAVFDDSDEEEETDSDASDNAIDDEDDDAWEDEGTELSHENEKEMKFHRVDSKANLRPNRSLLTLNLVDQKDGNGRLTNANSRSSPAIRRSRASPNGPSMPASPTEADSILAKRVAGMNASEAMTRQTSPAQPPAVQAPAAMPIDPRTTKRNMLCGELSESLRFQMLNERKFKHPFKDQGQMRRAHTATDMKSMARLPGISEHGSAPIPPPEQTPQTLHWNQYFNNSVGEFHQAGW